MSQAVVAQATAAPSIADRLAGALNDTRDFLRLLSTRPVGMAGFIGVIFFVVLSFVVPLFVPLNTTVDVSAIYAPPSVARIGPPGGEPLSLQLAQLPRHAGRVLGRGVRQLSLGERAELGQTVHQ